MTPGIMYYTTGFKRVECNIVPEITYYTTDLKVLIVT